MPKAGEVKISVRPWDAGPVADWLRSRAEMPATGILAAWAPDMFRDPHDVIALAVRFDRVARRRRVAPALAWVEVDLPRNDAVWLAARAVRPFGTFGKPARLPDQISAVCRQCVVALNKKRGPRTLKGEALIATIAQSRERRHHLRLKARLKREQAEQAELKDRYTYADAIADAIADASSEISPK